MPASFSKTIIVVVVLALALVGLTAGAAFATPPYDGAAFAEHVSTIATADHLGAEHNPGNHHGVTGWQEMHPMPMAPTQ
jgi:hypothetical protein